MQSENVADLIVRCVREDDQAAEQKWLADVVYGGASGKWRLDVLDARTRYSDRG